MANRSDVLVVAIGSALISAEMASAGRRYPGTARPGQTGTATRSLAKAAELALGEVSAGPVPVVIGSSQSASPNVTNIADQASRRT
jgi:hypothetical protein